VFANTAPGEGRDILINVFLRGGIDALNLVVPFNDPDYVLARPRLKLSGNQVAQLDASQISDIGIELGLHPAAAPLRTLMNQNHLAIVAASGSTSGSRSHFEQQDFMDRGKPDDPHVEGGWLGRYLQAISASDIFAGVSKSTSVATSLEGFTGALALPSASGFSLNAHWNHRDDMRRALRLMYQADADLATVARRTLEATDFIDYANPGSYTPEFGAVYPSGSFGGSLTALAQLIKMDVGLKAATVDLGGWDTHEAQANSDPTTGTFNDLVAQLSTGLAEFWKDMTNFHGRLTVVVMSEFGRRLRENDNRGTDHGHGGVMMVLSANVVRGRIYGTWPGLKREELFESVDLQVTTDFRRVLSEVVIARLRLNAPSIVFPDYSYQGPVGIFGEAGLPTTPANGMLVL
jgi:uncharacterized protein (DUF1501 family)